MLLKSRLILIVCLQIPAIIFGCLQHEPGVVIKRNNAASQVLENGLVIWEDIFSGAQETLPSIDEILSDINVQIHNIRQYSRTKAIENVKLPASIYQLLHCSRSLIYDVRLSLYYRKNDQMSGIGAITFHSIISKC